MKLREEDLQRHRPPQAKPKRRWLPISLLLVIIVAGGIYAYNSREHLPSELKTPVKEALAWLEEWNPLSSQSPEENPVEETINLDGLSRDLISRDELQELLNTNFARLNTKVDTFIAQVEKLQNDVEYVGALGRSVREKVTGVEEQLGETRNKLTQLEQSINNQEENFTETLNTQKEELEALSANLGQREEALEELSLSIEQREETLEELALRVEQMDTQLQADIERLTTNINTFNEDLNTLKEAASSLQTSDGSQQLSISELEQIIRNLNARLIELER